MESRILLCLVAVGLAAGWAGVADAGEEPSAAPEERLSLENIVRETLKNNPRVRAAEANWEAMRERVPQARAWEDARASFDQRVARFAGVAPDSFSDEKLMVEQTLPISGRNRLRGAAAMAEASRALEELRRRRLDTVERARAAYFRLANAQKQLQLNRKNSDLLQQFAAISRAKMAAGDRSQGDVLTADTELAKLDEGQFDLQRDISEAQTELNVLMNRAPDSPLARPADLAFKPVELSLEELEGLALANRPEVAMAKRQVEAAQARLREARNGWIPEPRLRIEADRYNQASEVVSEVDAGFSIDLPWFNRSKYRAAISENERWVEAAQRGLESAQSETLGAVVDQFNRTRTFHHHTELYQVKLLPLARENVSAQRSDYESSKTGFLEILVAQRTAQETESMYWDHLMHYETALAELEALIGVDLPVTTPGEATAQPRLHKESNQP